MTEQRSSQRSIFETAIEKGSPEERAAYLDQACRINEGLRKEVEALLAAHDRLASVDAVVTVDEPRMSEAPGTVIGPYKLLQQIGEGGMGTVFMADQTRPVERKVALKVIKPGMDSRQVIARFEAERQALAMMDHVNIARVFDGGATEAGRPYFVMELVHGVPITKYCDDNHLTPRARLELFVPVCQAIQHAHQKGIIHRDVKPSNVMITLCDGKPVPKVIDFGVAKATERRLTERTLITQYGTMVGTLEYMSPEQAEMSALGVDTRSDIYSLGVLLYELLTGSTPLSRKRVRAAAYTEILRMIKEEDPPKPSSRLCDTGEELASISAQRRMEPDKLAKLVRGELDWIVMKSLEKDRNRRYETANGFAADVQRYLNDEAVQACPPSARYRLRKFARRNRRVLATALVVAGALVIGTAVSVWQAARARHERDNAVAEEQRAGEEAAIASAVNDFLLNDLLAEAAPNRNARNKKVTVEELLGRAAARIEGKFQQQPRIEAAIRKTIGDAYRKLGNDSAAQPHLERALELRRRVLGEDDADTLAVMHDLAALYLAQHQLDKAEPLFLQALEGFSRLLGEEDPKALIVMKGLGMLYLERADFARAEPLLLRAVEVGRRVLGEDDPSTLIAMNSLAMLYFERREYSRAEPLFQKILKVHLHDRGEEHTETLSVMNNLALVYKEQGEYPKAESLFLKTLEIRRRIQLEDHPDTLGVMNNLALLYLARNEYAKAEPLFVKAVEGFSRVRSEDHPSALTAMNSLALLYQGRNEFARAEPLMVKIRDGFSRAKGPEHRSTLTATNNLALLYRLQGKLDEAEPLFLKILEVRRGNPGENHLDTLLVMNNLALVYYDKGELAKAEPLFQKVREGFRRDLSPENPSTLTVTSNLVSLYQTQGELAKAEPLLGELLENARKRHGEASLQYAVALAQQGLNHLRRKKPAEAEPLLRACLKIRELKDADGWTTFATKSMLGGSLLGQKNYAEAGPLLLAGYQGMKDREAKIPAQGRARLAETVEWLVQLYDATKEPAKAAAWRKKLEGRGAAQKNAEKTKQK